MIKKVLIAGLFLGGGYLFIKKILPQFVDKSKSFDVDTISIEDRIAEEERKQREVAKKVKEQLIKKFGTTDPKALNRIQTYYGTGVDFDNLTPEQIESIRSTIGSNMSKFFPNGLTYDPNNLSSFKGFGNVTLSSMFG
jgi:hypothetical protein